MDSHSPAETPKPPPPSCSALQVAELNDVRQLTTAAVAGLEQTLERIERSAASASASGAVVQGGAMARGGGARRVPAG
jgi:hypothetical protein